ncbi:MAG: ABC transporter substrate-binding protein [Acidobacteriota bacterium]
MTFAKKRYRLFATGRYMLLLPVILMVVFGFACRHGALAADVQREKITIGISPTDYSLLIFIAMDQGFFEQNGLEVTLKEFPFGYLTLGHLADGEIDFGTAADFAFVGKSFETTDLRVLASICRAGVEELVARKDKGIAAPADLKGKKVGVTLKTVVEFSLMKFLAFNGMSMSDVTLVNLPPAELYEAFARGEIDAFGAWDVWVIKSKELFGDKVVSWPTRLGQDDYWLLCTRKDVVENRSDTVMRLMKALLQADDFAAKRSAETRAIMAKYSKNGGASVEYSWENNKYGVSLDQSLLEVMEDEADWKIKSGGVDKADPPNYLRLIWDKGLNELSPEANTIFR